MRAILLLLIGLVILGCEEQGRPPATAAQPQPCNCEVPPNGAPHQPSGRTQIIR